MRKGIAWFTVCFFCFEAVAWEHGDLRGSRLGGELGQRREIQQEHLFRYQAGNLRGNEGFLDFEGDLIGYFTNRLPRATVGKVVLCGFSGVGMALDAAVLYAATSGDTHLIAQKDHWIDFIIDSQDDDGYFGMIQREDNDIWMFRGWVVHDGAYLCLALMDNYEQFGHEPSLRAARKFIGFVMKHWRHGTGCSPVGITEALFRLYELTGDEKYLHDFADVAFDGRFIDEESVREWKQYLYPPDNSIESPTKRKVHTYRFFARCIEQLDLNGVQPDSGLEVMTDYALGKMADPQQPGMFISGATGRDEGWVEDQKGLGGIGEACAVAHQVWLLDRLIEQRNDLSYGDWMERMVLNHMCAAQNVEDGRSRYFTPLSGVRTYHKGAHCCEGNIRRFWARLPQQVFYTGEKTVAVNLFTPSERTTSINGTELVLEQVTDYPKSGIVELRVDPKSPVPFSLELRIPRWAPTYSLELNGQPISGEKIQGGVRISKPWKPGDIVRLEFPMQWRWVKGHGYYDGRYALMRGPQLFCISKDWNPKLKGVALSGLSIDPASIKEMKAIGSTATRKGQMARATGRTASGDTLEIVFVDFPEENGEETYFHLTDPSVAVEDELYHPANFQPYLKIIDARENPPFAYADDFAAGASGESLGGNPMPVGGLSWTVSRPGCEYTGKGGVTFIDGQSTTHGHVCSPVGANMLRIKMDFCPADPAAFVASGRITLGMGPGYNRGYWAENGRDTLTVCMGSLSGEIRLRAFDFEKNEQRISAWADYAGFVPQVNTPQIYSLILDYDRRANEATAILSNKVTGTVVSNSLDVAGMELVLDTFGFEMTGVQVAAIKPHIDSFEINNGDKK